MAVPKRKASKSRTRRRHSHNARITVPKLVLSSEGEYVLPHRVDMRTGYYKGKQIFEPGELE